MWNPSDKDLLEAAAHTLYHRLHPTGQIAEGDVLGSVTQWAFQVPPDPEVRIGPSQTRLSLVNQGPRKSYVALRERLEKQYGNYRNTTDQTLVTEGGIQEEQPDIEQTVIRVSTKKRGEKIIREIEIGEEEWQMFKQWMEERKNN